MKEFIIWLMSAIAVICVICFIINKLVKNYYTSRIIGIILCIVALTMAKKPEMSVGWVLTSALAITFLMGKSAVEKTYAYTVEKGWTSPIDYSWHGTGRTYDVYSGGVTWWLLFNVALLGLYAFFLARHWPVLYYIIPIMFIICTIIDFIKYKKSGESDMTGSKKRK